MVWYHLSSILFLAAVEAYMHLREKEVLRALVPASEALGSCLSVRRDRVCWLCVCDEKSHSPARLHLLENTVLLSSHHLPGKPLSVRNVFLHWFNGCPSIRWASHLMFPPTQGSTSFQLSCSYLLLWLYPLLFAGVLELAAPAHL